MGARGTGRPAGRGYHSPRREMQAGQTRARIIAAAAQRFLAHGYAGTTMRMGALDACVALPTVELAFRTKARLLKPVVDVPTAAAHQPTPTLHRHPPLRPAST